MKLNAELAHWVDNPMPEKTTNEHKVFVLEDDARIRARFCKLVNESGSFAICGAAGSLTDAKQQQAQAQEAAILLVDLRLPDGNGTSLIAEAASWSPRPFIAVISSLGDERSVITAMEAGADGYLLKDLRPEELVPNLEALMRGESPISPAIARYLLKRFRPDASEDSTDRPNLSDRESEILQLVARGYSHADIAEALGISNNTVITHIRHIYRKLDVHSRSEAVYEAANLGLLKVGE